MFSLNGRTPVQALKGFHFMSVFLLCLYCPVVSKDTPDVVAEQENTLIPERVLTSSSIEGISLYGLVCVPIVSGKYDMGLSAV